MKIDTQVKSGLSKALKWVIGEGSDRTLVLKLPNLPETSDLKRILVDEAGQPGTTYFTPLGKVDAWQWSLPLSRFRNVWSFNSPRAES